MKTPIILFALVIVLLLTFLLLPEVLQAQAPSLPAKPTQNPIDGGLALLAAAGGGYAIKKLRERKD